MLPEKGLQLSRCNTELKLPAEELLTEGMSVHGLIFRFINMSERTLREVTGAIRAPGNVIPPCYLALNGKDPRVTPVALESPLALR